MDQFSNLGASGYEIVITSYPPLGYFKVFKNMTRRKAYINFNFAHMYP